MSLQQGKTQIPPKPTPIISRFNRTITEHNQQLHPFQITYHKYRTNTKYRAKNLITSNYSLTKTWPIQINTFSHQSTKLSATNFVKSQNTTKYRPQLTQTPTTEHNQQLLPSKFQYHKHPASTKTKTNKQTNKQTKKQK